MEFGKEQNNVIYGEKVEGQEFAIGDVSFVMKILRKSMYSNSIKIICQEIMSNARDAHRELGNEDRPIEVTLPTESDPQYRVRDFGIGIEPRRMSNIFIQYGSSTKRDSNSQTGGFGLGSKTPFSYTDVFHIVTVTPERHFNGHENCNVKRTYLCFIDETKVGKLVLNSEFVTDDERGTEIVIPVKPRDFHSFENYTKSVARWWNPVPVVHNLNRPICPVIYRTVSDDGKWAITDDGSGGLVIDSIHYDGRFDFDTNSSEEKEILHQANSFKGLVVFFDTGEVDIAASRENVERTEKTNNAIITVLKDAVLKIKDKLQKEINDCKTYWSACSKAHTITYTMPFAPSDFTWNGDKLRRAAISFSSSYDVYRIIWNDRSMKPERNKVHSLWMDGEEPIFAIDNTGNKYPSLGRAASLLEKNDNHNQVIIISPRTKDWYESGNMDWLDKAVENGLVDFGFESLNDYELKKFPNKKSISNKKDGYVWSKIDDKMHPVEIDFENQRGIYVTTYRLKPYIFGKEVDGSMSWLCNYLGISKLYGIIEKNQKKLGDHWVKIDDVINERLKNLMTNDLFFKHGHYSYLSKPDFISENVARLISTTRCVHPDSFIKKCADVVHEYKETKGKVAGMERLWNIFNTKMELQGSTIDVTPMAKKLKKMYPLLAYVEDNTYGSIDENLAKEIILYIRSKKH